MPVCDISHCLFGCFSYQVRAHWLFLMTDVDFLYTANPKTDPNAKPIYEV